VIERATRSDSVGFLRGLRFPPTLHYKSPNIVYRANVLVDAQLSIQYLKNKRFENGSSKWKEKRKKIKKKRKRKDALLRTPFGPTDAALIEICPD
jgi:hypothetical protein